MTIEDSWYHWHETTSRQEQADGVRTFVRGMPKYPVVTITDEAIQAFGQAWGAANSTENRVPGARRKAGLRAALTALGIPVSPA